MKINSEIKVAGLCAIASLVICGCNPAVEPPAEKSPMPEISGSRSNAPTEAVANVNPAQRNEVKVATPAEQPPKAENTSSQSNASMEAMVNLNPTQGNEVKGTVTFTKVDNGVRVVADITGLKEGEHGFHVHEKGDCSAPDGSSAGGHFNPTGMPHGGPDAEKHHIGDLGNITADASGKAHLDHVFSFLALSGTNSIVGRGFIVHAGKDDLTSQPSGNAGARVACGVIELKK